MRRISLVLALGLLVACSDRDAFAPEGVDTLVVDAVLVVDRPMPTIFLSRTLAPDQPLIPGSVGESQATVRVLVEGGGEVAYDEDLFVPGRYVPLGTPAAVAPDTRYELQVTSNEGDRLSAVTLTPPRLVVDEWLLLESDATTPRRALRTYDDLGEGVYETPDNQITYNDGILEARFTSSPASEAAAVQVALFSLDLDSDFVIDPEFFEDEDFEDLDRANYSPMFSGEDGFVRLPWFAIFFEGRYQIKVWSVDQNWNDYVRSSPALTQGGGFGRNAGETFERPIFRVEGGIGLFGSAAVDSIGFAIRPSTP